MSTVPEQLEFDLGDDVSEESVSTVTLSGANGYGFSASTIGAITASTITLPNTVWSGSSANLGTYTITDSSYGYNSANVYIDKNGIDVKDGDIKVGGKSLTEAIKKIEDRLAILHPNPELEEKWEQLKELRRQYEELEKDLLEKEKLWKILKK